MWKYKLMPTAGQNFKWKSNIKKTQTGNIGTRQDTQITDEQKGQCGLILSEAAHIIDTCAQGSLWCLSQGKTLKDNLPPKSNKVYIKIIHTWQVGSESCLTIAITPVHHDKDGKGHLVH